MARKAKFNLEQVAAIKASTKTQKELAAEYNTSQLTIGKIKRGQGAYNVREDSPALPPVLDNQGRVVGFDTTNYEEEL